MSRSAARAFTLLELAAVLAIISILASLAVPTYVAYVHRAREVEALIQIETIAYLEEVRVLELGAPIALPRNPSTLPRRGPARFERQPEWLDLGLGLEGPVYFQYRVDLDGSDHFVATAVGDVDGDGVVTRVTLGSRDLELKRHVGPVAPRSSAP